MEPHDIQQLQAAIGGKYLLEREIGRGGTATVYRARERKHDRPVAVKVLHPALATSMGADAFLGEIEIVAGLQHPNILPLLDSGAADGVLYFVMPYVEGPTLAVQLAREHRLSPGKTLHYARQIAGALEYAHENYVAHLDVKPANILLSHGHAVVTDFGIARAICDNCTPTHPFTAGVVGTPGYMSPEQVLGSDLVDGRSDVYGLACVVFEMLAGTPPFGHETVSSLINLQMGGRLPSVREYRPTLPVAVDTTLHQALSPNPEARPSTPTALVTALAQAADMAPAWRARTRRARRPWVGRRTARAGALAAILSMLGFGGSKALDARPEPEAHPAPRAAHPITLTPDVPAPAPEPAPPNPKHC